ncbi:MAG TPA: lytic transglycosylase domain-containing protein [Pyrinomonadaceae bacterium]
MRNIVTSLSLPAFLLGIFLILPVLTASVQAQTPVASPSPAASADPKAELKTSLTSLSTLYQSEVTRLEEKQKQSKTLYDDGLISRLDFEAGEKTLADARAKVEEVAREIEAANKPPVIIAPAGVLALGATETGWSTGNARIDGLIRYYGKLHGVDPFLIYCTMSQESGFSSGATSYKGAQGLMQLMPDTAARYGVSNPYDAAQSISGGTRYLKDLLKMFNGRVDLALAGYNAGEGAVMKFGNTIPPYSETRSYVKLILQRYNRKPAS